MEYIKLSISADTEQEEIRDILTALLGEFPFHTFEETESGIAAHGFAADFDETVQQAVLEEIRPFAIAGEFTLEQKQNWNEEWEKNYFQPVEVHQFVRIAAPFHPEADKIFEFNLSITPKMSFGTGNHGTTFGVMELMENYRDSIAGKIVLDMGAGTGILGILASKLDASEVVCIDIEDWACENCEENAAINQVENLSSRMGNVQILKEYKTGYFDFILANIQKNVLLADMKEYASVLNKNGFLLMSGFYKEDLEDISTEAGKLGLELRDYKVHDNWIAAIYS